MPPQNNADFCPVKLLKDYKRLRRLINENGATFCAFDTETTGLSYKNDKIIEVGAVRFDKSGVLAVYDSFIKVGFALPPIITQITHITDKDLETAPDCQKVMR
ncbi:MAG: 3'-5' exonuclease, partial [Treponema sp.]|nr:3'-5' exonuclease [Treponema sp.]